MPEATSATIREASISDCHAVEGMLSEFGMGVARRPEDVERWWDWMWRRNPALASPGPHPPPGWVLESEGETVGFFGNLPAHYQLGEQTLQVSVASHWAVQKAFRTRTPELAAAYFEQAHADLLLVTTGIAATGRIFARHGATAMPREDYRSVLYWVADPAGFADAALRKRSLPGAIEPLARLGLGSALGAASRLRRSRPGRLRPGLEPEAIPLGEIGDAFDDLWERKLTEGRCLYACRRAEDIRWHFEMTASDAVWVVGCQRAGRLDGYLVLRREQVDAVGLDRLKIVDLLVASDDLEIIDALLAAAWEKSAELGCHVLELIGFSDAIRARASRFRPWSRMYEVQPFHYKARSVEIDAALHERAAWYPCQFDGDGCLGSIRE